MTQLPPIDQIDAIASQIGTDCIGVYKRDQSGQIPTNDNQFCKWFFPQATFFWFSILKNGEIFKEIPEETSISWLPKIQL